MARTRPGMVPLDLRALGAAYYTGNCHKWLCAPKGAAFLHVRRDRQAAVRPLTISHGATGARPGGALPARVRLDRHRATRPRWLRVPKAIEYLGGLVPGGWPALMARNRALVLEARAAVRGARASTPAMPRRDAGLDRQRAAAGRAG